MTHVRAQFLPGLKFLTLLCIERLCAERVQNNRLAILLSMVDEVAVGAIDVFRVLNWPFPL